MGRRLLTEFLGTFLFVTSIGLAIASRDPMAPLAIGAALMVLVYMGGPISGAHYNPVVSLALVIRGRMSVAEMFEYWVAQIAGALLGGFVSGYIVGRTFAPAPGPGVGLPAAFFVEAILTLLLVLVILNVAAVKKVEGNQYYGLAIGFTIVATATFGGPISGSALNPAVGTGAIVSDWLMNQGSLGNLWIYWVGPFVGGIVAALIFGLQHEDAPAES